MAALVVAFLALRAGRWVDVFGVGIPPGPLSQIDYGVNVGPQEINFKDRAKVLLAAE